MQSLPLLFGFFALRRWELEAEKLSGTGAPGPRAIAAEPEAPWLTSWEPKPCWSETRAPGAQAGRSLPWALTPSTGQLL